MLVSIWHDLIIYEYFFCTLAYLVMCFMFYCVVCIFFCNDHLFNGSRWSCRFRGTFGGWEVM